ncbi:MAG: LamG domain-containing protein, partial [Phycisphaeraceae bacterium]|nr:LamG domain-containing protein [Phycisphaeraceae bacterium]
FATPQDWTLGGITTLSIAVRGNLSLTAANQLYVKINDTKMMYDGDLSVPIWQQWPIDLTALGINLSSVTTMSFGVEGNGSGVILLDEIQLHRTAPPVLGPPAGGDKSLVAHWKFDETEGLAAADSSGYGNDGTLVGMEGTEWTTGTSGGALEFSGAGQYVEFGNDTSLEISSSVTISAWVRMNAGNDGAYMGIGGKLARGPYAGFSLVRFSSGVFRLWADGGANELAGFEADSDLSYTDTEWHHVAGVVDAGTSMLYVDGVKQTMTSEVNLTVTNVPAHIGRQYNDLDDRYWTGLIDDVRIYYRALSEQEISGL